MKVLRFFTKLIEYLSFHLSDCVYNFTIDFAASVVKQSNDFILLTLQISH